MLYIIPTPIGNLKDITLRALEVLQSVDGVICEDTRRTGLLLQHFQIKKPLVPLNDFNEYKNVPHIIGRIKEGMKMALLSDAGTPLVSDPGYKLVREAIREGIEIDSLPGPTSITTALTLSGLPPDKFLFLGYLPEKIGHRTRVLEQLKKMPADIKPTFIAFVAPHKLIKTLTEMLSVYGDIGLTLAKELTKIHQRVETKSLSEWLSQFSKVSPKGEFVMLFRLGSA
jgi:16S rRNA (cytidine1402-2'-O)-methyltransferase